ncbi:hypothetical protein BC830DRAFT_563618 [Chytriomyces sp. MP71]|nr:hypothetical protein BC830DRAFT_563618 [Chytriomyces sp. MP71]
MTPAGTASLATTTARATAASGGGGGGGGVGSGGGGSTTGGAARVKHVASRYLTASVSASRAASASASVSKPTSNAFLPARDKNQSGLKTPSLSRLNPPARPTTTAPTTATIASKKDAVIHSTKDPQLAKKLPSAPTALPLNVKQKIPSTAPAKSSATSAPVPVTSKNMKSASVAQLAANASASVPVKNQVPAPAEPSSSPQIFPTTSENASSTIFFASQQLTHPASTTITPISQHPDEFVPINPRELLQQHLPFLAACMSPVPSSLASTKANHAPEDKDTEALVANARLVQWQFLLAKSTAAFVKRKAEAERQIYQGWTTMQSLKEQIHNLKSEIAARKRIAVELEQLQSQEESLRAVLSAISIIEKDYRALADGLRCSVVRIPLNKVYVASPEELRDNLNAGNAAVQAILDTGSQSLEKMKLISSAVTSLEQTTRTGRRDMEECVHLFEQVSRLKAVEKSYLTEREQLA